MASTLDETLDEYAYASFPAVELLALDGAAVNPSMTFLYDQTLGFFRPDDGILGITTEGIERARINEVGDMSIGTTSDANARLELRKTTEQLRLSYDTSNYLSALVNNAGLTTLTSAGGMSIANDLSVDAGHLYITDTTADQFKVKYDGSNEFSLDVSSGGVATMTANGGIIVDSDLDVGAGHLYITDTTADQFKVKYDGSNEFSLDVSSGGVATMTANGGVVIDSDLTVSGTTTTISSMSYTVADPYIYLAYGNVGNLFDIGWFGTYNDGAQKYTGIVHDATDGIYKLYDNLTTSPTNVVPTGDASFRYASIAMSDTYVYNSSDVTKYSLVTTDTTGGYYVRPNTASAAIGIGPNAGLNSQGTRSISIGFNAGLTSQSNDSLAVGVQAGYTNQGTQSIALGLNTAFVNQGDYSVAIGTQAGLDNQAGYAVSIGENAGNTSQGSSAVAIGRQAGYTSQNAYGIGIGYYAGYSNQGVYGMGMGFLAGHLSQGQYAIGFGYSAGYTAQGVSSIAIGTSAGSNTQGTNAVAIGNIAGRVSQSVGAVGIGYQAGNTSQGSYAVALGYGAGATSQGANSIVINASGALLSPTTASALFINPVRNDNTVTTALVYNTTTKEVTYSTSGTKTFVIDHPVPAKKEKKYLVHACLEGPEAGVYYRGKGEISPGKNKSVVYLPDYVDDLAYEFTVQITAIYNGKCRTLNAGEVKDGKFTVYGKPGKFHWLVQGRRLEIDVEPDKGSVDVDGMGPYKFIKGYKLNTNSV